MDYYKYIKPLIFRFNEESSHEAAIWALKHNLLPKPDTSSSNNKKLKQRIFGLNFINPVGMAAGFDKNAECISGLCKQGFGFVETGTVTPIAQAGNPKPRIFRLEQDKAIINKMGFNNKGSIKYTERLQQWSENSNKDKIIVGANIGKNKNTEDANSDYIKMIDAVYGLSDYITINISSPNTPNLRKLQKKEELDALLKDISEKRTELIKTTNKNIPLLLKIAPDIDDSDKENIAEIVSEYKIDGLIISNTTIKRDFTLEEQELAKKEGGLSGKPLFEDSTSVLKDMYNITEGKIPLIGVGGIFSGDDAYVKIKAGASLIQIYTSVIYEGFELVNRINKRLLELLEKDGFKNISDAIGVDAKK